MAEKRRDLAIQVSPDATLACSSRPHSVAFGITRPQTTVNRCQFRQIELVPDSSAENPTEDCICQHMSAHRIAADVAKQSCGGGRAEVAGGRGLGA
jgi:hypothetical protein